MPTKVLCKELLVPAPNTRKLYLSYLRSDALVRVIDECELQLYVGRKAHTRRQRELLHDILADAVTELRGRQLELFSGPEDASGRDSGE